MFPSKRQIEEFLAGQEVAFAPLTPQEHHDIEKRWLAAFASKVKKETGVWVFEKYRWHGFNLGLQPSVKGEDALKAYLSQWPAPYVIFDERGDWTYACTSSAYPDFAPLGGDIYVAHHNMKWTMAFTHEQPEIGPFFSMQSDAN